MRKMLLAGVVVALAFGASVWAQSPAGAAQRPAQAAVGSRFVDANGDGVCDNYAIGGGGFGRGMGAGYGRGMGAGFGRGMRGGSGAGLAFGPNGTSLVDLVARATGQERTAVLQALQSGRSLAQIGEASGRSVQDLVAAVLAERQNIVEQAVAGGRLTHQQADLMMASMRTRIELNLAGTWQPRGGGVGGLCPLGNQMVGSPASK
jgi:hypothetical protein